MVSNDSENRPGTPPVIGISSYVERARHGVWDHEAVLLPRSYVDSISRAGGTPVVLPSVDLAGSELLARLDGIVLAGGADIDPARYGMPRHAKTGNPRTERDGFELDLLDAAIGYTMPVLGVCRGMQLLNVALGGSLSQHLPDTGAETTHQPAPATFGSTAVTLEAGSLAARILGPGLDIPCYHHQGIDKLGDGLRGVGWAADGTVEALELRGAEFVLGVQWHPEVGDDLRLFAALVDAANDYRVRTQP